jgi:Zn-dependent protease/predicted transcriptional regulator
MPGRSFRIARIAGIPVGISPLWLIIVALITWSLGADYYPSEVHGITPLASYALGLASALLLFASILAHEFGHALVARRRGVQIEEIDLWLLGGVARMTGRPQSAGDELRFALAGPAVTAVVCVIFGALAIALPSSVPAWLRALVDYQAEVNLLILGFNLLPAFPLDGGRVARALLWRRSGDIMRATNTAAGLGRGFGWALIAFGVLLTLSGAAGGLWFAVIGVFLVAAAGAERLHEQVVVTFTGVSAAELMSHPVVTLPSELTLADAQRHFEQHRYTAFPVTDPSGRAIGLLTINQLARTPRSRRATITVGELADRDPALLVGELEDVGQLLERAAFMRVGRAAVVDEPGRPVGIVSLTDIERTLRSSNLRNNSSSRPTRLASHP